MLLGVIAILVVVLVVMASLVAACAVAVLTLVVGLALRSSRFRWLSPFLISPEKSPTPGRTARIADDAVA